MFLIHDIVKNALTDEISNIDFYSVKMDEKSRRGCLWNLSVNLRQLKKREEF